nr:recombinase family protein [Candidatus Brachybacter algidus]
MDQNLDRQLWEIRKAGAEKIFQEKLSGKSMNSQVELQQALQFLREKDVLVIESLDRLGRNYAEIVQIVQKLDRKKIGLQILNMPILNQDMGTPIFSS